MPGRTVLPYNTDPTLYVTYGQVMNPKTERFELRMAPEELAQVDEWRRKEPDLPPRAEAVRRLIQLGLKARGKSR